MGTGNSPRIIGERNNFQLAFFVLPQAVRDLQFAGERGRLTSRSPISSLKNGSPESQTLPKGGRVPAML